MPQNGTIVNDNQSQALDFYFRNRLTLFKLNDEKRPMVKWRKDPPPPLTRDQAEKHLASGLNLGVALPDDVLVIDIDVKDGKPGLESAQKLAKMLGYHSLGFLRKKFPVVLTPSGGIHVYLRLHNGTPPLVTNHPEYPGVDFQNRAQMVVAAGGSLPGFDKPYEGVGLDFFDSIPLLPDGRLGPLYRSLQVKATPPSDTQSPLFGVLSPDELETFLNALPAEEYWQHDDWVGILMASHHATGGNGQDIVEEWSASDPEYGLGGAKEVARRWGSFGAQGDDSAQKTVFHLVGEVERRTELDEGNPAYVDVTELIARVRGRENQIKKKEKSKLEDEIYQSVENLPPSKVSKEMLIPIFQNVALLEDPFAEEKVINDIKSKAKIPVKMLRDLLKSIKKDYEVKGPADFVDLAAQKTLTDVYAGGKHLGTAPSGDFEFYDGKVWKSISEMTVKRAAYTSVKELEDRTSANRTLSAVMAENVKAEIALRCQHHEDSVFNQESKPVINCLNGSVWLKDPKSGFKIAPHRASDRLSSLLPIEYDPSAKCPSFDVMLEQVFAPVKREFPELRGEMERLIEYFWELVGYMVQPDKDIPAFVLWIGPGLNGKSKIAEIISRLVGDSGVLTGNISDLFRGNPHVLENALGKLIWLNHELPKRGCLDSSALKDICQSSPHAINQKHKKAFQAILNITPLLLTNHSPRIEDSSEGMRRRAHVIEFNANLKHLQDSKLPEIAETKELAGILNKALAGLQRLRARGGFQKPRCATYYTEKLLERSNTVMSWWGRYKRRHLRGTTYTLPTVSEAWDSYQAFLDDSRRRGLNRMQFEEELYNLGLAINPDDEDGPLVFLADLNKDEDDGILD